MADNKNIDESAERSKNSNENAELERIKRLENEVFEYGKLQKFIFGEFKRSESYKKYTSLETYIPKTNKSIGADVARLLLGQFKEQKIIAVRDKSGTVTDKDVADNSFRARLKRSGLTSFGRYLSDDKEGIGYDILRTVVGRFSDDFLAKKKELSEYEKENSKKSSQQPQSENGNEYGGEVSDILKKISEDTSNILKNTEGFVPSLKDSNGSVEGENQALESQIRPKATDLENEIEFKRSFDELKDSVKMVEKNVQNIANLVVKSTGGASNGNGDGSIIDNIADLTTIGALGKGVFGKIGGAFGSIFGKVKGFGTKTVGMLKYGAQVGTNKALPLLHSVKDSAKSVGTNILEKGKSVGANILEKGKGLLESGKSAINNIPTPKILDFAKKGGIIGAGITAISSIFDINKASDEIDEKVKSGVISKEDANRAKLNSAIEIGSKGAGGAIGGLVGMSKGAALGATLGSVVPVLGTGVGAVLGGLIGGFGGEKIGSWLGGFFGDSVTNDVKENKSFAERRRELKEERSKVQAEERNLANEIYTKNLDELAERGIIKKTVEKDGTVNYEGHNYGASAMSRARYDAKISAGRELFDKKADIEHRSYELEKEIVLANLSHKNISPSNKNLEGAKMVNESEVANYKEKQRQAKSDKASDNVINNNVHTEVKNQTVQNRQLKPRSDHSIYERLHGSD